jgi:hypothetical protein
MIHVPDRQNPTSLSKVGFFLNTTDSLLQNRGNFGRGSLRIRSKTDLLGSTGDGTLGSRADLSRTQKFVSNHAVDLKPVKIIGMNPSNPSLSINGAIDDRYVMEAMHAKRLTEVGRGLHSPRRVCQWQKRRPRSGWIAAKRS